MVAPRFPRAPKNLPAHASDTPPLLEALESRALLSAVVLADFMPADNVATWIYNGSFNLGSSTQYSAMGLTKYVTAGGSSIETNSLMMTTPDPSLTQGSGGFTRSFASDPFGAHFSTESMALPSNAIWSDTYSGQAPTLPSSMNAPGVYNVTTATDHGHIDNSSGSVNYILSVTSTETYEGMVSVTTPAGTFLAAKITEHRTYAQSPLSLPNPSAPGLGTLDYTIYLAQGIGIVRKTLTTTRLDAGGNPLTFASDFSLTQSSLLDAPAQLTVRSAGVLIPQGDISPTTAKGTAFGSAIADQSGAVHVFAITNTGSTVVHLGGTSFAADSIFFSGIPQDFTVVQAPALTLAPGATTRFKVAFTPAAAGLRPTTVYIFTRSPGDPYSFKVRGTGTPATGIINVSGGVNPIAIQNNAPTPTIPTGTRFGQVPANGGAYGRRFIITNTGPGPFRLTGPITISGVAAGDFSIITDNPNSLIIPAGSSVMFRIRFSPTAVGLRKAKVTIYSDTTGAPAFTFQISGTGT